MAFNVSYIASLKDKFSAKADKIKSKTDKISRSFSKLRSQTKKAEGSLSSFGNKGLGVFTGMAAALVAATGVRTLLDFGKEISKVKALTGATGQEFQALKDQAQLLGKTTQFSAAEAAAGMAFLAQAGFDANKIMGAMPAILNLAAAGSLDLASAADIVSNIMTPFGISAENTEATVDALAIAASSSNTNIQQLGGAMKNVAPVAASLNISMNKTAAAIGVLGDSGIQAERAGTGLKIILQRLIRPVGEVKLGIKSLGISASKLNPATNDMVSIFRLLNDKLSQIKDPAKRAAIQVAIFGQEAAAVGTTLIKSVDRIESLSATMDKGAGAANNMASIMRDNLAGDVAAATSAFSGLILGVGDRGLGGGLRSLVQTFTTVINAINEISGAFPFLTKSIVIVTGVLMGMAATIAIIAKVKIALALLNAVMIANPIVAIVTAIVVAIVLLISHWDLLKQAMQNILDFWSGGFIAGLQKTIAIVGDLISAIGDFFTGGEVTVTNKVEGTGVGAKAMGEGGRIDGRIEVAAPPGVVRSVESRTSGSSVGNLGMNMEPAI